MFEGFVLIAALQDGLWGCAAILPPDAELADVCLETLWYDTDAGTIIIKDGLMTAAPGAAWPTEESSHVQS